MNLNLRDEENKTVLDDSVNPTSSQGLRYVVSGTGGAGKTVLMKHLLNMSINNRQGMIPLFIELRNLEFNNYQYLFESILSEMRSEGADESSSLFRAALDEGLFAIFLDGFDEINPDTIDKATKLISKFSRTFINCSIIISTRPGTAAHSLHDFTVFHLNPLDRNQAIELVEKTKFDAASKSRFLQALKKDLYKKHPTMMSIPILIVMMLLTFRSYADIPDRMTVFYGQAFDTLYSIHDAEGKESYKRVHHCGLPPDTFRKVLNAFCYLSLSKYEIEFSSIKLREFIKSAILITRVDADCDSFINDLVKNVCILQPEGINYVFVHRSFQEYFAACFAASYSGNKIYSVYEQILMVAGPDFARMLIEIDKSKLFRVWTLPKLTAYLKELEKISALPIREMFGYFFSNLWVDRGQVNAISQRRRAEPIRTSSIMSSILDRSLSATQMLHQIKLRDDDILALDNIDFRHPENSSKFRAKAISISSSRRGVPLEISPENDGIFDRSNARVVFDAYLDLLRSKIVEVTEYVDDEKLLDDVLLNS